MKIFIAHESGNFILNRTLRKVINKYLSDRYGCFMVWRLGSYGVEIRYNGYSQKKGERIFKSVLPGLLKRLNRTMIASGVDKNILEIIEEIGDKHVVLVRGV